jgi:hypothetical protein
VQDKLALDTDEERALELRREIIGVQERVVWNPALSIPAKEIDFCEAELARLRASVDTWDGYNVSRDRVWLEPLLMLISGDIQRQR